LRKDDRSRGHFVHEARRFAAKTQNVVNRRLFANVIGIWRGGRRGSKERRRQKR
jgi:hypothetical protein